MGQLWGADSGGSQGYLGQNNGQTMNPTRRGVERSKTCGLWTTEMVRKPPPSGGGGIVNCCSRGVMPPATYFGSMWSLGKKLAKIK